MDQLVALGLVLIAAYVVYSYVRSVYRQNRARTYQVSCVCGWRGQTSRLPLRCPNCRQIVGLKLPKP